MKLKKLIFTIILLAPLFSLINAGLNDEQPAASSEQPSHDCNSLPGVWQCKIPRCPDPFISLCNYPTPEMIASHLLSAHEIFMFDLEKNIFFHNEQAFFLGDCIERLKIQSFNEIIYEDALIQPINDLSEDNYKDITEGKYNIKAHCVFCQKTLSTMQGLHRHYQKCHPHKKPPRFPLIKYKCHHHCTIYTHEEGARKHIKNHH